MRESLQNETGGLGVWVPRLGLRGLHLLSELPDHTQSFHLFAILSGRRKSLACCCCSEGIQEGMAPRREHT